jgi:hypothetical protein
MLTLDEMKNILKEGARQEKTFEISRSAAFHGNTGCIEQNYFENL